jgi:uncharacterized protein (DUF302 family)
MQAEELAYTVETAQTVEDAVRAVQAQTQAHGFRVLGVHDVGAILAEKGFVREPYVIVEICNARYASAVLAEDVRIGTLLPCKVSVFRQDGRTFVSALRPMVLGAFFPADAVVRIAQEVEEHVRAIVEAARAG